ncbi:MAG: hypothetical protein Q9201_002132 [Fulgogasparrea decipioides]
MTIWKQRFFRWNYFFVSGLFWDMSYIIRNWKLGWWEIGAKLFVFQEVYETLLYLLAPFVLPISFYVRPQFSGYLYVATLALYQINVIIFNYMIGLDLLKFGTPLIWRYSIYKYAKYFAKRHPKVIEDEKAVAVVLRLEEESYSKARQAAEIDGRASVDSAPLARRFTVTAVGTDLSSVAREPGLEAGAAEVDVVDFATQLASVPEDAAPSEPRQPYSTMGRMPPPIPPSRRPYSWQRTTSNTSSGSNVSPFDERKKPQFSLPSSETDMAEKPPLKEGTEPTRRTSPSLFRRSIPLALLRRSPERRPQVRRPSGAPRPDPSLQRSSSFVQGILRHHSSRNSDLTFHIHTPTIEPPPPATLNQSRHFIVVSSAQDIGGGWPLRGAQPDTTGFISELADTSSMNYTGSSSREGLFIHDEGKEEADLADDDDALTLRDGEEFEVRESMQTERSSTGKNIIN